MCYGEGKGRQYHEWTLGRKRVRSKWRVNYEETAKEG
ncbi:MAG: hypothetical protein DDT38_01281 [Firmicutes bacterium]|nr:hypothetical protein [candidate division NPL-UPA2 bacterium]